MTDRHLRADQLAHAARAAGQPQPDLREQLAAALALPINGPASDGIGWYRTEEQSAACHAQATAVLAVVRPLLDAKQAEVDAVASRATAAITGMGADVRQARRERDRYRLAWMSARQRAEDRQAKADKLVAFIERGFDTHMQFGVIEPDGTTTMLPCADWCHACKLEKAEAERDGLREQLAAAGLVPVDQPPGATVLECSRVLFRTHDGGATWTHHSHTWEPQPGMTPVWCPGVSTTPKETT